MWWAVLPPPPLQRREPADEEGTSPLGNWDCHPEKASLPGGAQRCQLSAGPPGSGSEHHRRAAEKPHGPHASSLLCWACSLLLPFKPSFAPLLRSTTPNSDQLHRHTFAKKRTL